ncbi:deoxyribodipyrimidine photo-lyase [Fundidesulfovibrio soli]|uniref:deoxyribodipyrimidine photo-lyase n=1 Tax=Fundidesulfovibrio soli TaxID=2922716 RepID=UPI001FAF993D|nr:deoxyribodipyrimidine photo-lyase [Fundidesulfovibrio soli]
MTARRGRILSRTPGGRGPVLHWMHRDHRLRDNWSLLHAWELAQGLGVPLVSAHCLDPAYPGAEAAHFRFLMEGLDTLQLDMAARGIPLLRLLGDPPSEIVRLALALDASAVVADFDPLRHKRAWLARAASALPCPLHEADARNVVPCFTASDKPEYMARTIRPKIHRLLPEFLTDFPEPPGQPAPGVPPGLGRSAGEIAEAFGKARATPIPGGFAPGERAGQDALEHFLAHGLHGYAENRNDPARDGQSGLSPWLHFGMLSAQRVALAVGSSGAPAPDKEAFLEELIVRRELADNFCLHHQDYDSTACFPQWAARTLEKHAADPRPALYSADELEQGRTLDPAWNAAQLEMVRTGKMHGYMRMYWAKKILEWTPDPATAMALAVAFNDRHSLDGRDPNGYAGIAWAIGGVHDRPWSERPVFGQVRYMNFAGLRRKFDIQGYVERILG